MLLQIIEYLTGIEAASQSIAARMKSTADVLAQMVAEIARKLGKGISIRKRAVRAFDSTDEIVGAAAVDASGKRPRSSASTGDLKGAFPGSAT